MGVFHVFQILQMLPNIIYGAFMCGTESTDLNIKGILNASYTLFHDSTARRADYPSITASEIFPLSFRLTRFM